MAFKRLRYKLTNSIEVMEFHTARYGAPGQPRAEKKAQTPEAMAKVNQRNRERKCSRMIDKYLTRTTTFSR